jgi:methyl-accepting chemotaxis protein
MDSVTQQNAALVEEAAAAAGSMQEQAANLTQVVSVFKVGDGAAIRASQTSRAAATTAAKSPSKASWIARLGRGLRIKGSA